MGRPLSKMREIKNKACKIGNLKLKNPYFLAPMLEPNDIAFRLLCKKAGSALTYTGMINPLNPKEIELKDKPAIQIFCNNEKGIKEFIKKYEKKASLFDFNLGCPSKVAKNIGFGSFLHNDLKIIEKILKIMRNSTKKPITIKLRKSSQTIKIAKLAEKYCDAIAIHPRTQEQGYSGKPDIKFAEELKKAVKIPVIYSGDVNENNAKELLKKFDFIMIGRASIGNPNIFAKLTNKQKRKIKFNDYLKLAKKRKIKFSQIKMQAMWFTKSMPNATKIRDNLSKAKNIGDIEKIYEIN